MRLRKSALGAVAMLATAMVLTNAGKADADTISATVYGSGASGSNTTALSDYAYLVAGGSYTYTSDITQGGHATDWKIFSATSPNNGASYDSNNGIWDSAAASESISDVSLVGPGDLQSWSGSNLGLSYPNATNGSAASITAGSMNDWVFAGDGSYSPGQGVSFTQTMSSTHETLTVYFLEFVGSDVSTDPSSILSASTSGGGSLERDFTVGDLQYNDTGSQIGVAVLNLTGSIGDVVTVSFTNANPLAGDANQYTNAGFLGASVVAVPEPASATLALLGLGGLFVLPRRRRHA